MVERRSWPTPSSSRRSWPRRSSRSRSPLTSSAAGRSTSAVVAEPAGWAAAPVVADTVAEPEPAADEAPVAPSRPIAGAGHRRARRRGRGGGRRARTGRRAPAGAAARSGRAVHPGRLVPRSLEALRDALLGRRDVDRVRVEPGPDVHRPARRLTLSAGAPAAWRSSDSIDARHVARPRRHPDRDRGTARSCATRGSCRRSSARGSCSPATTSSPPSCWPGSSGPTSSTSPTSTATTSTRPSWPTTSTGRPTVLLPDFPTGELERRLRGLGFTRVRPHRARPRPSRSPTAWTIAIHVETSVTDGPGGDSALVVDDGERRLLEPERLPPPRPRRPHRHGADRPAVAAVLRRHLVPDGVRPARRRAPRAVRGQGRVAVRPGHPLRRGGRGPSVVVPVGRARRASSTPSCSA